MLWYEVVILAGATRLNDVKDGITSGEPCMSVSCPGLLPLEINEALEVTLPLLST